MFSRHIEMAPEIEPRHLANALSVALTAHQAIGDMGFPIPFIARGSATNEHGRTLHTRPTPGKRGTQLLWHYKWPARTGLRKNQRFSFGESAENG